MRRIVYLAFAALLTAVSPAAAQLGQVTDELAKKALGKVLDNELAIRLDANTLLPQVAELPGGRFNPRPLPLTGENLMRPLGPGDYSVQLWAFCTEYSVHRPGAGTAYELAPLQGKNAQAIATLFWRGMATGTSPGSTQAVAWGIQSGIPYGKMPKAYKEVIDHLIPDFRKQLSGNVVQQVEDTYTGLQKLNPRLQPLDRQLMNLGKPGELLLSAKRQQAILLAQNTNDQQKTQILFAGQNSQVYRPLKAKDGPWSVLIPGRVYGRVKVIWGNQGPNELEIRILPAAPGGGGPGGPGLGAGFPGDDQEAGVPLWDLLGGNLEALAAALDHWLPILGEAAFGLASPEMLLALGLANWVIAYSQYPAQALIMVPPLTPDMIQQLLRALAAAHAGGVAGGVPGGPVAGGGPPPDSAGAPPPGIEPDSSGGLTPNQKKIVNWLESTRHKVQPAPRSGGGSSPDVLVDGTPTELVVLTVLSVATLKLAIIYAAHNAQHVVIDGRDLGLPKLTALDAIEQAQALAGNLTGRVTVLTAEGEVTY